MVWRGQWQLIPFSVTGRCPPQWVKESNIALSTRVPQSRAESLRAGGKCARAHTERQNHARHSHSLGRRLCTASPVACVQLPSVTGGVSPIPDSTNQNLWGRVHCCPGTCADTELEMLPLSTRPEPSRQLRPFTRKARLQAPGRPGHPGVCLQ